jgi:hypothetical protein
MTGSGFLFLQSPGDLEGFIRTWEAGALPKEEWTHAAHVAVCAYFSALLQPEAVFLRMKNGILRHNEAVGTPNSEDRGYHETLTVLWVRIIKQESSNSI